LIFLFGDNENGGPNNGLNIIDVQLVQWRPKLARIGLRIVREKRSGIIWYKIASEGEK
jgi:hypothetical protein